MKSIDISELEKRIHYHFREETLLRRALTHRSASSEVADQHMERLEFLGDAVLGLVISEWLHHRFPEQPEGALSRMRASLVRKESLSEVARQWKLSHYLYVGESERTARGVKSPSIAANAVEALIGAVFQDSGWEAARTLVKQAWKPMLKQVGSVDTRDAKSRLQELTQAEGWGLPVYALVDRGVTTDPRFHATCSVCGIVQGRGYGARKKIAEIEAAEQAWQQLKKK